ncbi:FAD-dependent oxidoreductase [Brevibacterium sp. SMBL_HHYL_HB1]|uniref:NAD(P)/FAD-dependent oxidoreductase n=1 Tax=Brevibacterium sp. SMBL_HHYL_HB1 TaxID=2777556 RepID=UPI002013B83B|nr:FAD-dependent oxidoreductase [Brevibacterium sp. SMBL_HHYL_HB1]
MNGTINGQLGFWMSNLSESSRQTISQSLPSTTDLAIVGGGYTGLWAAYFYKTLNPDHEVTIFEAEQIGYGASGRNGGWVSSLVPGNRSRFAANSPQGRGAAIAMQREFIRSVSEIMETLDRLGIEADQSFDGMLSAAHTVAGLSRLQSKRKGDLDFGYNPDEVIELTSDEFRDRINIEGVHGGLYYPDVACVDPAKLVRGLAKVVEGLGVRIVEQARVTQVRRQCISVDSTQILAKRVFVCTEAYSGPLVGNRRLTPINSSAIATQPLPAEAWDNIGWKKRFCLNDSAHTFIYAQRTADDRIVIGGRGSPYRFASGTGGRGETAQTTVDQLLGKLRNFFPSVEFRADYAWSGVLGVTRDWNGSVSFDPSTGVGHSFGYAGHGVTSAFVGGRTLAELASGVESERTELAWVDYSSRNWEPEPIRWAGIHSMYSLFGIADRWEERRDSTKTSLLASFGSRLAGLHE